MTPTPTSSPTVWTIKALLQWTTEFLAGKGVEAPRLEAQILLAHVMSCPRIELVARSDEQPSDDERSRFKELIRRRVDGWPVAYLVGRREFYLLSFEVSPAVLIPRPDTETLVLAALDFVASRPQATVLDLGTGSGCIAVSVAHRARGTQVTASDISPDALTVARRNATAHGVVDRMSFLCGDLFAPIPTESRFDLVLSNPPYIAQSELAGLASDVRDHEPRAALDGGPDGLAFYRRIAAEVGRWLTPGGAVMVEVGWTQNDAVRALFADCPEFELTPSRPDAAGRLRVVAARKR